MDPDWLIYGAITYAAVQPVVFGFASLLSKKIKNRKELSDFIELEREKLSVTEEVEGLLTNSMGAKMKCVDSDSYVLEIGGFPGRRRAEVYYNVFKIKDGWYRRVDDIKSIEDYVFASLRLILFDYQKAAIYSLKRSVQDRFISSPSNLTSSTTG